MKIRDIIFILAYRVSNLIPVTFLPRQRYTTTGRMVACLLVATVSQVEGGTDAVPKTHMQNSFAAKFTSSSQGVSSRLLRLLNAVASDEKDIYQFGVFTGTGLKKIADGVRSKSLRIWGFDSFQGIPPETSEEVERSYG